MIAAQIVLGVAILVATCSDIVVTTTSVSSGRGPLSSRVANRAWTAVLAVHARTPGHRLLQYAGPAILFGIVLSWVALLSLGWALVFSAEDAFAGGAEVDFSQRLHFAATTVAGRGATSLELSDGPWWIIEQLCGLTGVALIGLCIAYVLPVVRAVANKRQVAASVMILGGSPQEILANSWNSSDFGDLDLHLIDLSGMLNVTTQMHLAYPVLYYFHSPYRDFALAPSVVMLDETLTIIECGLEDRPGMTMPAWRPARAAVDQLLTVIGDSAISAHPEVPPIPRLDGLRSRGLPAQDAASFTSAVENLADRRRLLRGFLAFEGREWPPDAPIGSDAPADDQQRSGAG